MPRQARIKGENSVYHIIQRGNERKSIFGSDDDKSRFLDTLKKMKEKYNFLIYAYCIMDNHVHLIINDNGNDISKLIKSINISYAFYYNYANKRCGHLFQDRFLSEMVIEDSYLLQVSKYIHNNPVKAKMVRKAMDYEWSSYKIYTGEMEDIHELVEVNKVLVLISTIKSTAIKEYIKLVEDAIMEINVTDIKEEIIENERNNGEFIGSVKEAEKKIKGILERKNLSLNEVITNLDERDQLIKDIRKNSSLSLRQIGELFGGISESRVSRILNKVK